MPSGFGAKYQEPPSCKTSPCDPTPATRRPSVEKVAARSGAEAHAKTFCSNFQRCARRASGGSTTFVLTRAKGFSSPIGDVDTRFGGGAELGRRAGMGASGDIIATVAFVGTDGAGAAFTITVALT